MTTAIQQLEIGALVGGATDLGELANELAKGGLRDSSIQRYLGAARAWKRYCIDRDEPWWDASTRTLIAWLDSRCRSSSSPASAIKMSLAAARFLQRGYCAIHDLEAVAYASSARMQLDAFCRSATMRRGPMKRARPLRLDELDEMIRRIRADEPVRSGVTLIRGAELAERDIALFLLGWWGALRADDLARLEWSGVNVLPCGIELTLQQSKTSREAAVLALAARPDCPRLCPVRAVARLRDVMLTDEYDSVLGLVTGNNVGRRITGLFNRHKLPGFSGHSLRAGFTTECAAQGVPDKLVQAHGRWRTAEQHAQYVRLARIWDDTPTKLVTLPA
jgi:integrase